MVFSTDSWMSRPFLSRLDQLATAFGLPKKGQGTIFMTRKREILHSVALTLSVMVALPAQAVVFTASKLDDTLDFKTCTPDLPDDCTLRTALVWANSLAGTDTIRLIAGNYKLGFSNGHGAESDIFGKDNNATIKDLDISSPLIIIGKGIDKSKIYGGGIDRVFDIHSHAKNVRFENLQILKGVTADQGGGIRVNDDTAPVVLTLKSVSVRDNLAVWKKEMPRRGGGIYFCSGTLSIEESIFYNNGSSGDGAGLFVGCGAKVNIGRSVFESNHNGLGDGAGIALEGATAAIFETDFRYNSATDHRGGAMSVKESTADLWGVTIGENFAKSGGGIYNRNSTTTLVNSTVSGNAAHVVAGGILNDIADFIDEGKALNLVHVTIANNVNSADPNQTLGSGLHNVRGFVNIRGTLFGLSHMATSCFSAQLADTGINTFGSNLDNDNSCGLVSAQNGGTDKPGNDPGILPLADNGGFGRTHAIQQGSPAIDVLMNDAWTPTTDQRGEARDDQADIGAYEMAEKDK